RVSPPRRGRHARISTSTPSATVASALVPFSSVSVTRSDPFFLHATTTRRPTPRTGGSFGLDGSRPPANIGNRGPRGRGILSPPWSRPGEPDGRAEANAREVVGRLGATTRSTTKSKSPDTTWVGRYPQARALVKSTRGFHWPRLPAR